MLKYSGVENAKNKYFKSFWFHHVIMQSMCYKQQKFHFTFVSIAVVFFTREVLKYFKIVRNL